MTIDVALISRLQFAFTMSSHILFPSFSIGLAFFLVIMEGLYLKTKKIHYLIICRFWTKIFALTFGMGIVSGIVMEFQLGTNWNRFTYMVGGVLGPLFTYEVLTAFFIEAGFLGVMLFGWNRVGAKLHFFSTLLVFIGVTISAFWILSANSWMQTPDGAVLKDGQFIVTNWKEVIFNRSLIPRYIHMLLAAWITTGFMILGINAYYLLRKKYLELSKKCFSFALAALFFLVPAQALIGDAVGIEIHHDQPIKTAALEGLWHTESGAALLLFAIPDQDLERNYWTVAIPHFASLINTHEWNGKLIGLDTVPKTDRPFVAIPFFSFRIMVALAGLMLFIILWGAYLVLAKRLYESKYYLQACLACSPIGFIALWFGWITSESGRQPWVVYNILKTEEAVSNVDLKHVLASFVLIILVYGVIFGYFYFKFLFKIIMEGPIKNPEDNKQPFGYMNN